MKHNKYQKMMDDRLKVANAQILKDALTNPLLENAQKLPDEYKTWIDGSKLVAVLPALNDDSPNAQGYYSVKALSKDNITMSERISPVFLYINSPGFEDLSLNPSQTNQRRFFTFDSEDNKLYTYEKKPHSQTYHFVKRSNFETLKQYIIDNPVVLYFHGCDDGHVGKRFKTEIEAMEYLQMIDVFEDIFSDNLEHHN